MKKLKITLFAVVLVTMVTGNVANASFPIKLQKANEQVVRIIPEKTNGVERSLNTKQAASMQPIKPNLKSLKTEDGGSSGLALAGFICSIVGLLLFLITGWPFLLGSLGIIFGAIGLGQTADGKKKGRGFAIAGLSIGIIDVLLFWILVAALL